MSEQMKNMKKVPILIGIVFVLALILFMGPVAASAVEKGAVNTSIVNETSPEVVLEIYGLNRIRNIPPRPLPTMISIVNTGDPPVHLEELIITGNGTELSRIRLSDTLVGVSPEHARMQQILRKGEEEALGNHRNELVELKKNVSKGMKNKKTYLDIKDITTQLTPGDSLVFNLSLYYTSRGKNYVESANYTIEMLEPLPLPSVPEGAEHSAWYIGDVHVHSNYTDCEPSDGIYSISDIKDMAQSLNMNWTVITDHNYCLNSAEYDQIKLETTGVSDSTYASLFGEEVSVRELWDSGSGCQYPGGLNAYDTAHLGGVGVDTFVESDVSDWYTGRKASSPSSQDGINLIEDNGGLSIINHPHNVMFDFSNESYECAIGETGIELITNKYDGADAEGVDNWVHRRLLNGYKSYAFAGSDMHHNTPPADDILGSANTIVYADSITQSDIENALRSGKTYATTWQGLAIWVKPSSGTTWTWMGDTLQLSGENYVDIYVDYAIPTADSMSIRIEKGIVGQTAESLVNSSIVTASDHYIIENVYVRTDKTTYFRAWGVDTVNETRRVYTSPVWVNVGAGDSQPPIISTPSDVPDPVCKIGTGSPDQLSISSTIYDTSTGNSDIVSATLHYNQPGSSWTSAAMAGSFGSPTVTATWSGAVSGAGTFYYYITAQDSASNIAANNNNGNYYTVTVNDCSSTPGDSQPPIISTPSESADPICKIGTGSPDQLTISATISDVSTGGSDVASATMYHKTPGSSSWAFGAMDGSFNSPTVTATKSGPLSIPGIHKYYITAKDAADNLATSSEYTVTVNDCSSSSPGLIDNFQNENGITQILNI